MLIPDDEFAWVETWLDKWAADMRNPELRLGVPSKACGFIAGGYGENRHITEDWEAQGLARAVGIINAALDDMPVIESSALMHVKLNARFRFGIDIQLPYLNARMRCGIRLRRESFS